ncbi:MAG: DUF4150 domain-containing protein [Planctomycetota bacterium]
MASTVMVNSRGVVHKGSGGMNIVFPDVCKTPTPVGPVPIPYPNIGKSSDTAKGPKKVKCDGKMPMVKGAKYSMTAGDEAGSAQGLISSKIKGEAEFMLYSFDVKFEGKNVCRMGDSLFHNKKNAMG